MKRLPKIVVLLFLIMSLSSSLLTQRNLHKLTDSLKFITEVPYSCELHTHNAVQQSPEKLIYNIGCGDRYFWQVVQGKQEIIPYLIDKLADTTITYAPVPYFGGHYTVADVAYRVLQEIIKDIPTFALLGVEFDTTGCGYCAYWNYLRANFRNRVKFKKAVSKWYHQSRKNLVWIESRKLLTVDNSGFNHPNGGYFIVKK
jgi:hypothetical protein